MSKTISIWDLEGEVVKIPAIWIICDDCYGEGTRVNPNIDGNGISGSDPVWDDDDFREDYLSGRYDVACSECDGNGKVLVPDDELLTEEQQIMVQHHYGEMRMLNSLCKSERWAE